MAGWPLIVGGIGLFLTGMLVLTEGLRALAGGSLQKALSKYTKSPASGALTGAVTTALVQSSSATIVTAVGFVGAGMLTFSQSLGVIFGANIGTTLTGWLVALFGFKIKLGVLALPMVLLGALLRLYGREFWRNIGWSLIGFSLLFIGIATMQQGAASYEGIIMPSIFPEDTLVGRLQLVGIGVAVTLVTQSSSAGVATAMVALASGAISFPQAAAMVIGMDVGTTFTAVLATVGGSTPMRRTGYAHVIYNLMTGVMAFFLLGPAQEVLETMKLTSMTEGRAQIGIALFHTFFNFAGVALILPLTKPFARLIKKMVPTEEPDLSSFLDRRLLEEPIAAIEATVFTVREIRNRQFQVLQRLLAFEQPPDDVRARLVEIDRAIRAVRHYVPKIKATSNNEEQVKLVEAMHALDHMRRLNRRCLRHGLVPIIAEHPRLQRLAKTLLRSSHPSADEACDQQISGRIYKLMLRQNSGYRKRVLGEASGMAHDGEALLYKLDAMRWLLRVSYHVWRVRTHTRQA